MNISAALLQEVVTHALEDPGNEVCGLVAVSGDAERAAARVYRAINLHASPMKFEIEPNELLQLYNTIEDEGLALGAIYHSHVRSPPYPSQTDINFAANWPGLDWLIVGLAGEQPEVRCFRIDGPEVREVALEVS
jgi:proteasome lid subunit RPN8/RPN11